MTDTRTDGWSECLAATAAFVDEHGRWPERGVLGEHRLIVWLEQQRTRERAGGVPRALRAELDERLPGWLDDARERERWERHRVAVAAFVRKHRRWPSTRSRVAVEVQLAQWLSHQRIRHESRRLDRDRVTTLDATLPGWQSPATSAGAQLEDRRSKRQRSEDERWKRNLLAVRAFRAEQGRWPSSRDEAHGERELTTWLMHQRTARQKGDLSPARLRAIDKALPGWSEKPSQREVWGRMLDAVAAFVDEHGRRPVTTATDPDEQRLGNWMSRQRTADASGTLQAERVAALDARVKEWRRKR